MNKQQKLEELKAEVAKLEEELKTEPIIQVIPEQRLEWGKTADQRMNWKEAKNWCEEQGEGWRLPTVVELLQAYYGHVYGFNNSFYWSGTEYSASIARFVSFIDGNTSSLNKTYSYSVRCVRVVED